MTMAPARPAGVPYVCALAALAFLNVAAGETVSYGTGSWPETGNGNHRAVVRVADNADAVRAHSEWRRRDRDPETKDVRVVDLATGQRGRSAPGVPQRRSECRSRGYGPGRDWGRTPAGPGSARPSIRQDLLLEGH